LEFLARYGVVNKNENFITFHRECGFEGDPFSWTPDSREKGVHDTRDGSRVFA
jgi:hypothetical protein